MTEAALRNGPGVAGNAAVGPTVVVIPTLEEEASIADVVWSVPRAMSRSIIIVGVAAIPKWREVSSEPFGQARASSRPSLVFRARQANCRADAGVSASFRRRDDQIRIK